MNKLVMLDFDGVIADSLEATEIAVQEALKQHGIDHLDASVGVLELCKWNWFEGLERAGVPPAACHAIDEAVARMTAAGEYRPYEGIADAIAKLGRRHTVIVMTSNRGDIVQDFLRRWSIEGIESIHGSEHGASKVPKIRRAVALHNPDEAWFVGDTVGDMEEGREAGVRTIGVQWGWHDHAQMMAATPDFIADSPQHLLEILL